jgi:hypothetical protein
MLWVFSFKYWVVSVEMPKAITLMTRRSLSRTSNKSRTTSVQTDEEIMMDNVERSYFWIKWFGIIVNISFVTWYCIEYGKECMGTEMSTNIVVGSKIGLDSVAMVSGLFLGDALRRIWVSYKKQTGLLQNEKIMLLHLIMFILLVATIIGKTVAVTGYLDSKEQKDYKKSLAWYTANIWF